MALPARTRPKVLLVGAGAVGQVFGTYLQAAGCELSFLVKEKHAAEARAGFTLHQFHGLSRTPKPRTLSGVGVLVSAEEVAAQRWDQVWLCVSSTALRAGDWVEALARATPDATWVMLQPALEDRDWLLRWIPAERLVSGVIPFLSFSAPLKPGDSPASGTAFWFPPLARGFFSGPEPRLTDVLRTLRAGGYPAGAQRDVARAVAAPSAVLTVFVAALQAAGWRFERLLQHTPLVEAVQAAREAARVAAVRTGASATLPLLALRPALFRLLPLVSRFVPFDLEAYLRLHFTKVEDQTRLMLGEYVDVGRGAGLPVQHLEATQRRLPALPD